MSWSESDFGNSGAASAAQIDRIFARYGSPYFGKGASVASVAMRDGVNPLVLLAILHENSGLSGASGLKVENTSNPFAVPFNKHARGIFKLRMPDGRLTTFEDSLAATVCTLKSCKSSPKPLYEAA